MPEMSWPGSIADDIDGFVDAAVRLYTDKDAWQAAQSRALAHLQKQFDGEKIAKQLIEKINQLQQNLQQHRLDNFTGAMLKHHTLTSTKYLSQWIMEKNKNVE